MKPFERWMERQNNKVRCAIVIIGGLCLLPVWAVASIVMGRDVFEHPQLGWGDLLAIGSSLFYAGYLLNTGRVRRFLGTLPFMWVSSATASIFLLAAMALCPCRSISKAQDKPDEPIVLAEGTTALTNVPDIDDVPNMSEILRGLGAEVAGHAPEITITVPDAIGHEADYEHVRRIRFNIQQPHQ